MIKIY